MKHGGSGASPNQPHLFFLYESGDVERFAINALNLRDLVHVAAAGQADGGAAAGAAAEKRADKDESKGVVVIAHGWSEADGPNYPLIRTLEAQARRCGWELQLEK